MQLKTVKTASDVPFKGIELVKTDSTITEVIIGGTLRIKTGDYGSGLKVLVEVPGETVKRHRVTAVIEGFGEKVAFYETSYDADGAVRDLERIGATVTRDEVSVVVDAFGAVIPDAPTAEALGFDLETVPF